MSEADSVDVADFALVLLHHVWTMHDWFVKGLHHSTVRSKQENHYVQADVEQLFQLRALHACRMIANAGKHLDLAPSMGAGWYDGLVVREYDPQTRGGRLTALADGQYDLRELCDECVGHIRAFVDAHVHDVTDE